MLTLHHAVLTLRFSRSLQGLDPHANEYMDRLKDETILLALAQKVRCAALRWGPRQGAAGAGGRRCAPGVLPNVGKHASIGQNCSWCQAGW